ncbi:MAG: PAS domain S-box protein [Sulfuricellaceae bacterium]
MADKLLKKPMPPAAASPDNIERTNLYIPLLAYAVGVILLALAGYQTFRQIESLIQQEKLQDLNAIATVKTGQIVSWRASQERRGDAISRTTLLPSEFEQWLHEGAPTGPRQQRIAYRVSGWQQVYGYQIVSLVDRQGAVRLTTSGGTALDREDIDLARQAMAAGKTILSDIHNDSGDGKVGIDLAAPLIVHDENRSRVVGAALLQINPGDFLYPLIQSWPTHSSTAETLLVRQEGGSFLYLNELRHRKDKKALTLRLPVDTPGLPPGMFLRGKLDALNAVDYRGVAVVAAVSRVPGTAWLMVAKIDKAELFAPILKLKQWSAAVGLVFLTICGVLFFVWLRGIQARDRHLKAQRDAAVERELLLKHFEYLTQYANDMILVADENGKIVEANERAVSAYGYTRDELLGMTILALHPPVDDPAVYNEHMVRFKEAGELIFESDCRRKDGSTFPVEVSARVIEMAGVKYLQGIIRDITERKFAENALRKSAEQIEDLYNNAPCGYHSLDKDGVIIQINDTELQWLGYARDEVIGKLKWADLITSASLPVFQENFPQFVKQGFVHNLEFEIIRKNGMTFSGIVNGTAIYDSSGDFAMSRSTLFDITERRLTQDSLRESEARFRTMADNAAIMIWMADAQEGRGYPGCNFFNQGWHDFTGLTLERTQGRNWLELVHPDDSERCLNAYRDAFRLIQPFTHEYRLMRRDGEYRWMLDSGVPRCAEDGTLIGFTGTLIDITEQKNAEAMRGEIERIGRLNIAVEMASGLAHELSQPLSAANNYLAGCLHRMKEPHWDQEKLKTAVELTYKQTERAGKIINHLKELIRNQGHERLMVDINTLIRDTVNFVEHEIKRHGIAVFMELPPLPLVNINKIEIEQVLLNLLKNAIEAMHAAPEPVLRITTTYLCNSAHILVTVSDTGHGVPSAELATIFNPFQTSKGNGLGLGLAICRSLVENHGGFIWADAQREFGAEFNFTLPYGTAHDE